MTPFFIQKECVAVLIKTMLNHTLIILLKKLLRIYGNILERNSTVGKENLMEIYYVEDDRDIAEGVKTYLELRSFQVEVYCSISDAKRALLRKTPSLILIDKNMPDGSGEELCKWIRHHQGKNLPIVFLTVKGETTEIVQGFQDGADDYVVKPFEPEILYSRICALLRRAENTEGDCIHCDRLTLDKTRMSVYYEQEEIVLSQGEYQLLLMMMENKGKTITRERLLEAIWDKNGNFVNDNTLTVTMKRLREKLHQPACIKTIRSFGYRMEDTL